MANFVDFVYKGEERDINVDNINQITKKTYKGLNLVVIDYIESRLGYEKTFIFNTQEEAQAFRDLLRGKKNSLKDQITEEDLDYILQQRVLLSNLVYSYRNEKNRFDLQKIFDVIRDKYAAEFHKGTEKNLALIAFGDLPVAKDATTEQTSETNESEFSEIELSGNKFVSMPLKYFEAATSPYKQKLDKIRGVVKSYEVYKDGVEQNEYRSFMLERNSYMTAIERIKAILEEKK